MPQDSIYKGTKHLLHRISRYDVHPDETRCVSLQNPFFPTSYDLGPGRILVPSSPPIWIPQDLPVVLSADMPHVDPRTILASNPLDAMFRAINITSPDLALNDFDVITDRKNIRALFNFFKNNNKQSHHIDAELIGDTLLFYLGWSEWGYTSTPTRVSYGMNFERRFTSSLPEGVTQHNRVIAYGFGGLKVMVKYQVDACLGSSTPLEPHTTLEHALRTPTGLEVFPSGTMVSPESIIEIKTLREGYRSLHPRTMEQLWFSQTPILTTGYHDGCGQFSFVEMTDMEDALKVWEQNNTQTLQKVIRLLEMIREHLSHSAFKKQAIILENKGKVATVKFYSLVDEQEVALPEDLRRMWRPN